MSVAFVVHLVVVVGPLGGLDNFDARHGALDGHVVGLVVVVGLLVHDEQLGLGGKGLDPLDYLLVGLVSDVDLVDLDYPVALLQSGRLAGRALVDLPYELTILALLGVEVEPVPVEVVPLDNVAEPRARHLAAVHHRGSSWNPLLLACDCHLWLLDTPATPDARPPPTVYHGFKARSQRRE